MKTYYQFIVETKEIVKNMTRNWERKHKGMTFSIKYDSEKNNMHVNDIWLPPNKRGQGTGGRAMKGASRVADRLGATMSLRQAPEPGRENDLNRFYAKKGFTPGEKPGTYVRRPVKEAWIPPASKRLRGGKESPISISRKRGTDVDVVRNSVKRYAEPINNPSREKYDYSKDNDGKVTVKSKKHPIEVTYTPADRPNTFIQSTRTTGPTKDKVGSGREMQNIKKDISSTARPGTTLVSQPVGQRRASLNSRTQGMGPTDNKGVQAGVVRHRSPRQKSKGSKPMDPTNYKGKILD
jgi:hypothetical protein